MTYIVSLNLAVYLIGFIDTRGLIESKLLLIPDLVTRGEIWRLITYIFIPPSASMLWIVFVLYFYYMVGNSLENEWGSFRFNLYYLIGMAGTTIGAFITGIGATAVYLNLSLFLAFAYLFPNFELLLFFILPVKVKYLAWLNWAFLVYTVLFSSMPFKAAAVASVLNYFVFFGKDIFTRSRTNRQVYYNRKSFRAEMPKDFTIHRCTVCGKTEKSDPKMDFRYCSKCQGDYEYCMDHLFTHNHVKVAENSDGKD